VEHAFNCPCSGFPSIRHNEVTDLTASLLSEVCSDVGVEPALQPLDGEALQFSTVNREEGARLDVVARDFWGRNKQRVFFDVRVFNPFARSYFRTPLSKCYHLHEREKRQAYDERVRELAFHRWCLLLQVAWDPPLQLFLRSLPPCYLRSGPLITVGAFTS